MKKALKTTIIFVAMFSLQQCKDQKKDHSFDSKNKKSEFINSNRFLKPEDIKGKTFDDIMNNLYKKPDVPINYLPIETETFVLGDSDSWVAGIRQGLLDVHSSEEIDKKDFVIKEVT